MDTVATSQSVHERLLPQVDAARKAEQQLYEHYGLENRSHYVELSSGRRVRVVECGGGPPLLLIPGGVGDGYIWAPLIAQLRGYRLLVVDRPGGGLSDSVDHTRVDVRRLAAETLTAVLDHFAVDRLPIVCNSMGGLWSFWFALQSPERVAALIQLGCPALILDTSAPLPMRLMSIPLLNRLLINQMIPESMEEARQEITFLGHEEQVGANFPEAMAACGYYFPRLPTYKTAFLSLMQAMLTPRGAAARYAFDKDELRQVQPPVLYIWGDNDPFGSLDTAQRAEVITPRAELHERQGGHLPWWDDADACARLVRDFLNTGIGNRPSLNKPNHR